MHYLSKCSHALSGCAVFESHSCLRQPITSRDHHSTGNNLLLFFNSTVYNRDNRLKVARDEAEHAEQQRELDEKHKAAEAQARRKLLLERARERRAAALGDLAGNAAAAEQSDGDSDGALTAAPQQHQQEQARRSVHAAAAAAPAAAARDLQDNGQHEAHWQPHQQPHLQLELDQESQPVLEHINFWKDLESKAQHPEREVCHVAWL
jgi:hypothetical protein